MSNLLQKGINTNTDKEISLYNDRNTPTKFTDNKLKDSKDNKHITKAFFHLRTYPNPEYLSGLKLVPVRSCLLHNNVNKKKAQNEWVIKTKPKWNIDLLESTLDKETGEVVQTGVYTTNDLKSGNNRKIKALNRFCDTFQPLYDKRKATIWFLTLTMANQSNTDIRGLLNSYKLRLKRNGIDILGSIWVLEISPPSKKNLYKEHVHYHLLLATNRINLKGGTIPEYLKPNDLWGCRTQITFAQKHIRGYLSNYFAKNNFRIIGKRTYGISIVKNLK
jgi:hypothetical protein